MSHRLHAVLKMRPIATDIARSVVCVVSCAKRLNWLDRRSRSGESIVATTRGNKKAMGLFAKLVWTLVIIIISPQRMHSVHKMCAYCYRRNSVVCVSVCLSVCWSRS